MCPGFDDHDLIWARFVDFDVTLTNASARHPDVRCSKTFCFCFLPFFLVDNGHRAIKVHVNKVHYCRVGHL